MPSPDQARVLMPNTVELRYHITLFVYKTLPSRFLLRGILKRFRRCIDRPRHRPPLLTLHQCAWLASRNASRIPHILPALVTTWRARTILPSLHIDRPTG